MKTRKKIEELIHQYFAQNPAKEKNIFLEIQKSALKKAIEQFTDK